MPPKTEYWNHDQSVANPATAINPLFDDHSELNLETIALANQLHPQQTDASLFNPAFSSTTNIPQAHGQSGYQYNNDIHDEFYFEGGANISPPPQPYTNDSETFQTYPRSSSESSPNGLNISPGASEAASTFNGDTKPTNGNMFVPSSLSTSPQMSVPGPTAKTVSLMPHLVTVRIVCPKVSKVVLGHVFLVARIVLLKLLESQNLQREDLLKEVRDKCWMNKTLF